MQQYETQFPELSVLESPEEQRRILHVAQRRVKGGVRYCLFFVMDLGVTLLILFCTVRLVQATVNVPSWCSQGIAAIVGFVYLTKSFSVIFHRGIRRELRRELLERGMPVCASCGYDLRGQIEARCPECRDAFDAGLLQKPSKELEQE